jgi:hypothetical protein
MILGKPILVGGGGGIPCTYTLNTAAGASVVATFEGKTVTATADSNGIAVLTLEEEGVWTITATSDGESKSITVDTTHTIEGVLPLADTTLANNSWETISQVAKAGLASTLWKIGDLKTFTIGSDTFTAQIVDFDAYNVADSASYGRAKAGITFHLTESLAASQAMNTATTVAGGWGSSTLRSYCAGDLFNSIESELQNAIASVLVPYAAGKTTTISTIADTLFIPSEYEIFGAVTDGYAAEGAHFDYYAAGNDKTKAVKGATGKYNYWTRTVYEGSGTLFITVSASGTVSGASPANKNYVCPVFCV